MSDAGRIAHTRTGDVCSGCSQFGEPVDWLLAEARGHSDERPPTLTEFLLARIAEDEVEARNPEWLALEYGVDSFGREAFARRVLAECEAKRRIIERCAYATRDERLGDDYDVALRYNLGWDVLCDLASVYADHPDFRQEWRPLNEYNKDD